MKNLIRVILTFVFISLITNAYGATSDYVNLRNSLNSNSIPLINFTADIDSLNYDDYISGTVEIADYQKRNISKQLTVKYNCLVKYRGASSTRYDKKSLAFKLVNKDGSKFEANILNLRKDDGWILDAMAIDRIRMRNRVCFDLWNELNRLPYETDYNGRSGTVGTFVEVFINGEYIGLYCLTDRINRDLLGLKKPDTTDGQVNIKGVMYQGINWKESWNLLSYKDKPMDTLIWNAFELEYPTEYPSEQAWRPLVNLIDFCSDSTSRDTFQLNWEKYFYKENLIHYYVFTVALFVGDNLYKNTFLVNPDISAQTRFMILPWDMDFSLGGHWSGSYVETYSTIDRYNYTAPYHRLFRYNMDGFINDIKNYWLSVYQYELSATHVFSILDKYAQQFEKSGAWQREYQKWNNRPVPLMESLNDELDYVKTWYEYNHEQFSEQLDILIQKTPLIRTDGAGKYYNLQGIPVNGTSRGIQIHNNTKVYIAR